jgi:hypothetical protein
LIAVAHHPTYIANHRYAALGTVVRRGLTTETGGNGATNGDASRVARLRAVSILAAFNLQATSWTVSQDDGANSAEIATTGDLVVRIGYA